MKLILIPIKILLAFALTIMLFISLPFIYRLLGSDLINRGKKNQTSTVLMKVETQKQVKKKVPKIKPRQIKSMRRAGKSNRSFSMKFSPDLSVGSGGGVAVDDQNLENVVFEEGEVDVPAVPISITPIPYPRRAKDQGIEGIAEIILLIDRKGNVSSVSFRKIPHPMFKTPIIKTVKKWKFKPAMNKGIPVNMRAVKPIEFKLDE
jgi:protein TonB